MNIKILKKILRNFREKKKTVKKNTVWVMVHLFYAK